MPSDFEKMIAAQRLRRKQQYIQRMTELDPKGEFDEGREKSSNISADEMEALRQMFLENQRSGRRDQPKQIPFPGEDFRRAREHRVNREPMRRAMQDLIARQRGGFEDRPSTFTSIADILKNLPALRGLRMGRGAIDPMINAVRGQKGVQKLLFPPRRRKGK